MIPRALLFFGLTALLLGADGGISGPVTGYVFDSAAHSLRPILGLPGASLMGAPLNFGVEVLSAHVAPRQDFAFVVATDGKMHLFRITDGMVSEIAVDNLVDSPERVVFSPSGTAAALYRGGSVEIVKNLPNEAWVGGINLPAGTELDSLAISDDGAALLVSANHAVTLFGDFTDLGKLLDTTGPVKMAFAAKSHDAVVAESAAGLVLYRDLTGSRDPQVLAAADDALTASTELAFSADGKSLVAAAGQSVTSILLASGERSSIDCSCSPTTLARMGSVYRLNDFGAEPLWLFEPRPSDSRIVFVPALAQ